MNRITDSITRPVEDFLIIISENIGNDTSSSLVNDREVTETIDSVMNLKSQLRDDIRTATDIGDMDNIES